MSWNFLVQIPTFVRYIYGPIGEPFCALDMAFRYQNKHFKVTTSLSGGQQNESIILSWTSK
jgi:hypothetical protein